MPDIKITMTIPEAYQSRIKSMIDGMAGLPIRIERFDPNSIPMDYSFLYSGQGDDEGAIDYLKRYLKTVVKSFVECYEMANDKERYRQDVASLKEPAVDVPEEIIS